MKMMLLTFGENLKNHYQACFCILTLLRENPQPDITVYTDQPSFYAAFKDLISIAPVSAQQLSEWQGEHGFFWRIKCVAVQDMVRQHPGEHIVYLDSDTFLTGGLNTDILPLLDQGQTMMHVREGALCELRTNTERAMWHSLSGWQFSGVSITPQTAMWNAGVIALPGVYAQAAADLALALCDALCTTTAPRRLLEQFAFSLALNHVCPLRASDQWIGHYWGNKDEWNQAIAEFFLHAQLKDFSTEQQLSQLDSFDFSAMVLQRRKRRLSEKLSHWQRNAMDYRYTLFDQKMTKRPHHPG